MRVWRLVHRRHAVKAFSGEGAAIHGGRFNSSGVPVVYTSQSLSLAMLELIVQAGTRERLVDILYLTADFTADLVEQIPGPLPDGWDALPPTGVSQRLGDLWIDANSSAIVRVPSVLAPGEYNYLVNPRHRDFPAIKVGDPNPLPIDPRVGE